MKSDIDIKDDLYRFINGSRLHSQTNGSLIKTKRDDNSGKEDIVISINANMPAQLQEAYVYVNIYVQNVLRDTVYIENTPRLRELCQMSYELLEVGRIDDARFTLEEQRVFETDTNEHVITNKLLYRQCNY